MGDFGTPFPDIPTPDLKTGQKQQDSGTRESGLWPHIFASFFATLIDGLQKLLSILADVFDDVAALLTGFFTAAQGQDTPGFNRLVAAVLSDTLGVEVSAEQLQQAQFESGRVGAMKQVGADLFNTLGNEFVGGTATATPGAGIGGLPGTPGVRLTPEQGVAAAQSFIGFALSFAVRQGNVAFLSSALPWEWLGGIREYGEMMARNLGLGRLVRRALQPYIQTLIATPLQQALNLQYRPHVLDAKQIASAFIRGDITRDDYSSRLALLGFTDGDIVLLIEDTYTRLRLHDVFILQDNGFLSDSDAQAAITKLGYNSFDVPLLRQAHDLESVLGIDREYIKGAENDLREGLISLDTYNADVDNTRLSKIEKDGYKRNGANRIVRQRKVLSLAFLKRAYLDGQVTIDEVLTHMREMGYSQDDIDIYEVELLFTQGQDKKKAAAKAAATAAKQAKKTGSAPPSTPPVP